MKKLNDILKLSEIQDLTDRGKSYGQDINFLKVYELTEMYQYIQFQNLTKETVELADQNEILRALVVFQELSVRLLMSEK